MKSRNSLIGFCAMIVSLLLAVMFCDSAYVQSQPLRLALRLDGDSFLESEGIYAYAAVINLGTTVQEVQQYILDDDAIRGVRLHVLDARGLPVPSTGMVIDYDPGLAKPIRINPGDSLTKTFKVIPDFSHSGLHGNYATTTLMNKYL